VGVVDAIVGVVKHHEASLELMASAFEALRYVCRNGASSYKIFIYCYFVRDLSV
jgi:hypothetical protein